jgi:membrane protein implicated in regulation of membrane protease activity
MKDYLASFAMGGFVMLWIGGVAFVLHHFLNIHGVWSVILSIVLYVVLVEGDHIRKSKQGGG